MATTPYCGMSRSRASFDMFDRIQAGKQKNQRATPLKQLTTEICLFPPGPVNEDWTRKKPMQLKALQVIFHARTESVLSNGF